MQICHLYALIPLLLVFVLDVTKLMGNIIFEVVINQLTVAGIDIYVLQFVFTFR